MKNRKLITTLILIIVALTLSGIFYCKNRHVSLVEEESEINTHDWYKETLIQYDVQLCNFSILQPGYVLITEEDILGDGELDYELLHYRISNKIPFSTNWQIEYTGGTTIHNTTFSKLVKMVKEDCSQFQEDYDNPNPETGIDWGYREADPPKIEEEPKTHLRGGRNEALRSLKYIYNETLTDFQQEKFTEMFGDVKTISDDEIYAIFQEIQEAGGMEVAFKEYLFDEDGNIIFRREE